MRSVLLICFLAVVAAKLDVPHFKRIQIENLAPIDGPKHSNGEPVSFAGAVVIDGVSQANMMDMNCNNKFCSMMEYAVSCKAIGLGVRKICARYLLGYKYGCDEFPSPPEVVNAPSICIPSVLKLLMVLKDGGAAGLVTLVRPYLNTSDYATDTCGRRCFQYYQNASHDFYQHCRSQMNATYVPLAAALSNFQEYRNQACSKNATGSNCYVAIASMIPTPSPSATPASVLANFMPFSDAEQLVADAARRRAEEAVASAAVAVDSVDASIAAATEVVHDVEADAAPGAGPDIFNFYCNYGYPYANNMAIMQSVCKKFSEMGCCAATGITMVQQNPVGALAATAAGVPVDPTIFPPCLVKYFKDGNCGPTGNVNMQDYCEDGSIASNTVVTGWMFMAKGTPTPGVLPFPNMYSKTSVLYMQGAITGVLAGIGLTSWPYLFNKNMPLQVQIVDYTYYNYTMEPLTPSDGSQYQPYGGDYTAAKYGNFTFQIVVQDLNATGAAYLYGVLRSNQFKGGLNVAYTGSQTGTASVKVISNTLMYPAKVGPEPLDVGAGFSLSATKGSQMLFTILLTFGMSFLLMSQSGRGDRWSMR